MDMARDLTLLIPTIAVLLTGVLALIAEMFHKATLALYVTLAGLLAATVLSVPNLGQDTTVFMRTFRIDSLSVAAHLILLPATVLTAMLLRSEIKGAVREGAMYSLLSFATLGAIALAGAGDMMFLVLGLLLSSLASFALVGFLQTDRATEGAMKFFIYGSVTGAIMLFGLTYWFGAAGTTYLDGLARLGPMPLAGIAGLIGVLAGIGYKAGLVPVHFWVPDTYQGAPVSIAAYLSVVPKIGALFALAQVVSSLPEAIGWRPLLAAVAALTMTYGSLVALTQKNVVRLLAYSAIAQSGFFLLAMAALPLELGLQAVIYFAAAYAAITLGIFTSVMLAGRHTEDFSGLLKRRPIMAIGTIILLLSLAGIPPFAGFIGKLLLFGSAIKAGYLWLAIVGIINSILSLAAYLRIILPMMQTRRADNRVARVNQWQTAVWWISLILNVVLAGIVQSIINSIKA